MVIAIFVLIWAFTIWGIVDAATRADDQWARASQNKILWVVLQVVLGFIGTLIYVFAIRPKLGPRTA